MFRDLVNEGLDNGKATTRSYHLASGAMSMPPPGHPMHPEMQGIYGPPSYASPPRQPPTPEQMATRKVKEKALAQAIEAAEPKITIAVREFVTRTAAVPKIDMVAADSGLQAVKHWYYATAYRHFGAPIGAGWFVLTPNHPGEVTNSSSSNGAYTEFTEILGLAVTEEGAVFSACAPSCFEIEVRSQNIAKSVEALAVHTHGTRTLTSGTAAKVPKALAQLLDEAIASPVDLRPRITKREHKQSIQATYRYGDEKIFGTGGLKAYRKRMYGK